MARRVAGVRLVLAAVAAASVVGAPAARAACEGQEPLQDLWTRIAPPAFPSGPLTLSGYDVAEPTGDLVAHNGAAIATSRDGGCTWRDARVPAPSELPERPAENLLLVDSALTQVRWSEVLPSVVWAIGRTGVANGDLASTQPRVLVSRDGGQEFASRTEGLPPFGVPVAIRDLGGFALLLFKATAPVESYSVHVAGVSGAWRQVWDGLRAFEDFTVDPATGTAWFWNDTGLYRAGLAGTPEPPAHVAGISAPVRTVDVANGSVTAFLRSGDEAFVSRDRGRTFARTAAPLDVESASSHPFVPGLRAISSVAANVLVEPPAGLPPVDYSPRAANVYQVMFSGEIDAAGYPLYVFNAIALYRRVVPWDFGAPPEPPEEPVDVDLRRPKPVRQVPAILPADPVVSLLPGQRRTVTFEVRLPPVPTPLDVMFMTDSTNSMRHTINSVQYGVQEIVDGLAATGLDVWFGVADFRDHDWSTPKPANYAYKLHRRVGPVGKEFEQALEGIRTGGGTDDGHDSGLEAIYQAVTGAGRVDLLGREHVKPGLGAGFRPDAVKVVLVATDDNFRHPGIANPGYPGPSVAAVSEALRSHGVHLVGIEVDTNNGSARTDMERLARESGTVAPPQGVDCDDDGLPDVRRGKPIVCEFDPRSGSIAGAFVAMLAGIRDVADVDLSVTSTPLATPLGELHHPGVNVKAPSRFTLPVRFSCPRAKAGTETPVRIAAHSRGNEIVATTATVRCIAPDVPPGPEIVPPFVTALLPRLAAPLAPLPQPQPPAPNINPNPQLNPNAGFAAQEEQELQLALAGSDERPSEDLAMTGLSWSAALAMTGAAAFGMHRRRRTAPAPAFDPREYR